MKVIVAGYSKTGTKSMLMALNDLGYNVYDFMDHFWYHCDEWNKIYKKGGEIDDFKEMYKHVDAVTDAPPNVFWEEILQAFPDAKVILTIRDEKSWYKSLFVQMETVKSNFTYKLMQILSPTGWRYFNYYRNTIMILLGQELRHSFHLDYHHNEMILRRRFRQHTQYCRQNCPRDKLLVYNIQDGWKPLCEFLGKEIPDKEFPHENISGKYFHKMMATHPANIRMQREMVASLCLIFGLGVFGSFKLYKSGLWL